VGVPEYVSADEFAVEADISPQAARKIIRGASAGRAWRGVHLEIRPVFGRGGKSGLRYEVSLNSLLEALGDDLDGLSETISDDYRPTVAGDQGAVVGARFAAVQTALQHRRGTEARAASIRAEVAKGEHSERTLQRWIGQYERHGMPGLARKRPENAGKKRVVVSRHFDQAFRAEGYAEDVLNEIGALIDEKLKAIWASRAEAAGATDVGLRAEHELWKACCAKGINVSAAAMRLSRRHVERFVHFRHVNLFRNNRKAFDDGQPRIRRDWTQTAPMARIVADVKHLDVIVQRPDGSEAWPKVVGFHDAGTGRVFLYPLLLEPGEGVRQEHVIQAFIAMVSDPLWGFPKGLYLDNGTEFACFERISPALALVNEVGGREIIYAKPYHAASKTVENAFKRLDTYLFSCLPGYAGSDRMTKKTQTVGRPPEPYAGSWDEFRQMLAGLLIGFNARPYQRQDGKSSAAARFKAKVEAGWRPITVDPLIIDAAFSDRKELRIDRGTIKIGDRRFHHTALDSLPHRTKLTVALPWRRGGSPVLQLPDGQWIGAHEDIPYLAEWKDGAKEAARRKRRYQKAASTLAGTAPQYDPVAASLEIAAREVPLQIPGRADRLDGGGELRAIADGRAGASPSPTMTEQERAKAARDRETARLQRRQTNAA
jgi:hypothetical protein